MNRFRKVQPRFQSVARFRTRAFTYWIAQCNRCRLVLQVNYVLLEMELGADILMNRHARLMFLCRIRSAAKVERGCIGPETWRGIWRTDESNTLRSEERRVGREGRSRR